MFRIDYADQWGEPHREWVKGEEDDARALYVLRKAEVRKGTFDASKLLHRRATRTERPGERKLSAVIDEVLEESRRLASYRDDQRYAQVWKDELGRRSLDGVLPEDIKRFRRRRLEEDNVRPATVNRAVSFLRKVYYHAIDNGYCERSPVKMLGGRRVKGSAMLDEDNDRDVVLTNEDEKKLRKRFHPTEWRIVLLAIHTGLRQANLFGMRREWIDFNAHVITVPGRTFKQRVRHRCKMSTFVESLLRTILDEHDSPWVFPAERNDSKRGHLQAVGWVRNHWKPALAAVDLSHLHFHDLRATCATRLLEAGATEKEAAAQLGVSLRVIQRYVRIVEAHQLAMLERMSASSQELMKEQIPAEEVPSMRRNVRLRLAKRADRNSTTGGPTVTAP